MQFPISVLVRRKFSYRINKKSLYWPWASLSQILDIAGNNEIGRLLHAISLSPNFGIGMTSAIFQSSGKVLVVKEQFVRLVIVDEITSRLSFITLIGNLSGPAMYHPATYHWQLSFHVWWHRYKGAIKRPWVFSRTILLGDADDFATAVEQLTAKMPLRSISS